MIQKSIKNFRLPVRGFARYFRKDKRSNLTNNTSFSSFVKQVIYMPVQPFNRYISDGYNNESEVSVRFFNNFPSSAKVYIPCCGFWGLIWRLNLKCRFNYFQKIYLLGSEDIKTDAVQFYEKLHTEFELWRLLLNCFIYPS